MLAWLMGQHAKFQIPGAALKRTCDWSNNGSDRFYLIASYAPFPLTVRAEPATTLHGMTGFGSRHVVFPSKTYLFNMYQVPNFGIRNAKKGGPDKGELSWYCRWKRGFIVPPAAKEVLYFLRPGSVWFLYVCQPWQLWVVHLQNGWSQRFFPIFFHYKK